MALYVYIMTCDDGRAPDPYNGVCTLAYCMPMTRKAARRCDYVVGLAGANFRERRWHIIYAMRISKRLSPDEYVACFRTKRFCSKTPRDDREHNALKDGGALVSGDFVYWGRTAPPLPRSLDFLREAFARGWIAHRRDFTEQQVRKFIKWFERQNKGRMGMPFTRE